MLTKIISATLLGLECKLIEIEVDYRNGLSVFNIVGLGDKSVQEAKHRITTAIRNSSIKFVPKRVTVNLAPADMMKSGPTFDLAIAVGLILSMQQKLKDNLRVDITSSAFLGELSLDGKVKPVKGLIALVYGLKKLNTKQVFIPYGNLEEAKMIPEIECIPVSSLNQMVRLLKKGAESGQVKNDKEISTNKYPTDSYQAQPKVVGIQRSDSQETTIKQPYPDFAEIDGQIKAKRAITIAIAGQHNILLNGIPGSGKSMIATATQGIMPPLSRQDQIEVAKIHSLKSLLPYSTLFSNRRPFRAPHHSSSLVALLGGGRKPQVGEVSLAHKGILFLDELPEFTSKTIDALRQPIEDGFINISRANYQVSYPCDFLLIAAMNPCKCGNYGSSKLDCSCTINQIKNYQHKISGPIMDRFDLIVDLDHQSVIKSGSQLAYKKSSKQIRTDIIQAIAHRISRKQTKPNSSLNNKDIKRIRLDDNTKSIIDEASNKLGLTNRTFYKIIRVAHTIADLEQLQISRSHVLEAISYTRPYSMLG